MLRPVWTPLLAQEGLGVVEYDLMEISRQGMNALREAAGLTRKTKPLTGKGEDFLPRACRQEGALPGARGKPWVLFVRPVPAKNISLLEVYSTFRQDCQVITFDNDIWSDRDRGRPARQRPWTGAPRRRIPICHFLPGPLIDAAERSNLYGLERYGPRLGKQIGRVAD